MGALVPEDCEPSQILNDWTLPTARYRAPVDNLQECKPLIGSTPVCIVGVIFAPLPADPDVGVKTIVGAEVYPEPGLTIDTVATAPPLPTPDRSQPTL